MKRDCPGFRSAFVTSVALSFLESDLDSAGQRSGIEDGNSVARSASMLPSYRSSSLAGAPPITSACEVCWKEESRSAGWERSGLGASPLPRPDMQPFLLRLPQALDLKMAGRPESMHGIVVSGPSWQAPWTCLLTR